MNQNVTTFIEENWLDTLAWKMVTILSRSQYDRYSTQFLASYTNITPCIWHDNQFSNGRKTDAAIYWVLRDVTMSVGQNEVTILVCVTPQYIRKQQFSNDGRSTRVFFSSPVSCDLCLVTCDQNIIIHGHILTDVVIQYRLSIKKNMLSYGYMNPY